MDNPTFYVLSIQNIQQAKAEFRKTVGRLNKNFIKFHKLNKLAEELNIEDFCNTLCKISYISHRSVVVEVTEEMSTSFMLFMDALIDASFTEDTYTNFKGDAERGPIDSMLKTINTKFPQLKHTSIYLKYDETELIKKYVIDIDETKHIQLKANLSSGLQINEFLRYAYISNSIYSYILQYEKNYLINESINHYNLFVILLHDMLVNDMMAWSSFNELFNKVEDVNNIGKKVTISDRLSGFFPYQSTSGIINFKSYGGENMTNKLSRNGILTFNFLGKKFIFNAEISGTEKLTLRNLNVIDFPDRNDPVYKVAYEYLISDYDNINTFLENNK